MTSYGYGHILGFDLHDDADIEASTLDETVQIGNIGISTYFRLGLRSMLTIVSHINFMQTFVSESEVRSFLINLEEHSSKIAYGLQNAKELAERIAEKVNKYMTDTKSKSTKICAELDNLVGQLEHKKTKLDELGRQMNDIQCKIRDCQQNVENAKERLHNAKETINKLCYQIGQHKQTNWLAKCLSAAIVCVAYSKQYQSAHNECREAEEMLSVEMRLLNNANEEAEALDQLMQKTDTECQQLKTQMECLDQTFDKLYKKFEGQSQIASYFKECLHVLSIASDGADLFDEQIKTFYNIRSITGPLKSLGKMFQSNQLDITHGKCKDIDLDSINWDDFEVKLKMLSSAPAEWKTGKYLITSRTRGVYRYILVKSLWCL